MKSYAKIESGDNDQIRVRCSVSVMRRLRRSLGLARRMHRTAIEHADGAPLSEHCFTIRDLEVTLKLQHKLRTTIIVLAYVSLMRLELPGARIGFWGSDW